MTPTAGVVPDESSVRFVVAAFDLSFTGAGWAVMRDGDKPRHGVVRTPTVDAANYYPETLDRILTVIVRLFRRIREGLDEGEVLIIAIEGPSYGSKGGQEHARGGLWWMTYRQAAKIADAVIIIPPKSAKAYMADNGNADKVAMVAAVTRAFPGSLVTDDNEADAIACAAMVCRELGFPQEASAQRVRPGALDGVNWPGWITRRRTGR